LDFEIRQAGGCKVRAGTDEFRDEIAQLGFREGDRIVSVNGNRVAREADFIDYLLGTDRDRVEETAMAAMKPSGLNT
jgi:hypothetical protein